MTGISKHSFNTRHKGMSVFMLRLAILLFLGSLALVRKAQDEFYNNGEESPLRGLFQFHSGSIANMKDSFDDVSCVRMKRGSRSQTTSLLTVRIFGLFYRAIFRR